MGILLWSIILLISLIVLIKASDYFVTFGSKIGLLFDIPQFVIGITIVALGTSAPELVTSILAIFSGSTEYVVGTVVGSNISNILLIVGISAIVAHQIKSKWDLIRVDIPILVATTALAVFVIIDGQVQWYEGLVLLIGYAVYIWYFSAIHHEAKPIERKPSPSFMLFFGLAICMGAIYLSAKYALQSVIALTDILALPDTSFIAMSAVAIATSLPELLVSLSAIRKNNIELAFGNVLGSNVFNVCVVLAIGTLVHPLAVSASVLEVGVPFLIAAVVLYSISLLDRKITKYEGVYFLLLYALFLMALARYV